MPVQSHVRDARGPLSDRDPCVAKEQAPVSQYIEPRRDRLDATHGDGPAGAREPIADIERAGVSRREVETPYDVVGIGDEYARTRVQDEAVHRPCPAEEEVVVAEVNREEAHVGRGVGEEEPMMNLLDLPGAVGVPETEPPGVVRRKGPEGLGRIVCR